MNKETEMYFILKNKLDRANKLRHKMAVNLAIAKEKSLIESNTIRDITRSQESILGFAEEVDIQKALIEELTDILASFEGLFENTIIKHN